jgi:glycosyltransferase involved in cell wall biosynthesis
VHWHLITCEYPPQTGGVSDYSQLVAEGLAKAGEAVHVWCPGTSERAPDTPVPGVTLHRLPAGWQTANLRWVSRELAGFPSPRRLLVQWVPHGYGYRSLNLPFCAWLAWRRARHGDQIDIMFHEFGLAFRGGSWRQAAAAVVHRVQAILLLRAAARVWVSFQRMASLARHYLPGRRIPVRWLPVCSNLPPVGDQAGVANLRKGLPGNHDFLLGHFGTYGPGVRRLLLEVIPQLLARFPEAGFLLLGRGSETFQQNLLEMNPQLQGRVHASGLLPSQSLAEHIAACDVMVQPFPEGVTTRRTSVMGPLSLGRPVVTTLGPLTERLWRDCGAVGLATPQGPALAAEVERFLHRPAERARLGWEAQAFYRQHFDLCHTIAALRNGEPSQNH